MKVFSISLVLFIIFATFRTQQATAQNPDPGRKIMQAKLLYAQQLLEAIAEEDYKSIAKNSQQLELLSLDAGWQVIQTDEYRRQSVDFRRRTRSLTEAADKKNMDAAALGYVGLTLSCVECHKYARSRNK